MGSATATAGVYKSWCFLEEICRHLDFILRLWRNLVRCAKNLCNKTRGEWISKNTATCKHFESINTFAAFYFICWTQSIPKMLANNFEDALGAYSPWVAALSKASQWHLLTTLKGISHAETLSYAHQKGKVRCRDTWRVLASCMFQLPHTFWLLYFLAENWVPKLKCIH